MYYDEEIPAGYQEADLLQAEYERESNQIWAERKRGICHHGWQLGPKIPAYYTAEMIATERLKGDFPSRATDPSITDQASIPNGQCLCLDCGQLIKDIFA